jgi:hypothetical protein
MIVAGSELNQYSLSKIYNRNLEKNYILTTDKNGKITTSDIPYNVLKNSLTGGGIVPVFPEEEETNTFAAFKVLVTSSTGQITTSNNISVSEINYLNNLTEPIKTSLEDIQTELNNRYIKSEVDSLLNDKVNKSTYNTAIALKADKSNVYTKLETDDFFKLYYKSTEVDTKLNLKVNTTEFNNALNLKSDKATTFTKTETNDKLNLKSDKATTYTKTQVDTSLGLKLNSSVFNDYKTTVFTKTETNDKLNLKSDKATTYTKLQVDNSLGLKLNSSVFNDYKITVFTKTEINNLISSYYTKTQTDTKLSEIYNKTEIDTLISSYYTKTQTDTKLSTKLNSTLFNDYKTTVFTKTEVNSALNLKSDKTTTYTKTQVNDLLDNSYYTQTQIDNKIAGIVNSAPETLNTLNELAAALGNDPNFATTVSTSIGGKQNNLINNGSSDASLALNLFYGGNRLRRLKCSGNLSIERITTGGDTNNLLLSYDETELKNLINTKQASIQSYTSAQIKTKLDYVDIDSSLNTLLNQKQNALSNATGAGFFLYSDNKIKKLIGGTQISLRTDANSNIVIDYNLASFSALNLTVQTLGTDLQTNYQKLLKDIGDNNNSVPVLDVDNDRIRRIRGKNNIDVNFYNNADDAEDLDIGNIQIGINESIINQINTNKTDIAGIQAYQAFLLTEINKKQTKGPVSDLEFNRLDGVTANIQNQLNNKQVKVNNVFDTNIGHLSGSTSNIQEQLNNKQLNLDPADNTSNDRVINCKQLRMSNVIQPQLRFGKKSNLSTSQGMNQFRIDFIPHFLEGTFNIGVIVTGITNNSTSGHGSIRNFSVWDQNINRFGFDLLINDTNGSGGVGISFIAFGQL